MRRLVAAIGAAAVLLPNATAARPVQAQAAGRPVVVASKPVGES